MSALEESPLIKIGEWGWYASDNGEFYREGPEDTREGIIEAAKNAGLGEQEYETGKWRLSFTIARCQRKYIDVAGYFNMLDFLERIEDSLADEISAEFDDSSPLEVVKTDASEELQILVRNVIREWQKRHGYEMAVNTFDNIEDEEPIVIELPEEG